MHVPQQHVHLDIFQFLFWFRLGLLLVIEREYSVEYFQKSPETTTAKEPQAKGQERMRDVMSGRDIRAEAGKINVAEGEK